MIHKIENNDNNECTERLLLKDQGTLQKELHQTTQKTVDFPPSDNAPFSFTNINAPLNITFGTKYIPKRWVYIVAGYIRRTRVTTPDTLTDMISCFTYYQSMQSLKDCDRKILAKVMEQCMKDGQTKGKFNLLSRKTNKDKLVKYIASSNINGGNFCKTFSKKARFAKRIYNVAGFHPQRGIKHQLLRLYIFLMDFDYTRINHCYKGYVMQ
eukprot:489855_1